jgi:hypothetical protein
VAAVVLHANWRSFFRGLTPARRRRFERALAKSGLVVGEYMELVERAAMEAFAAHQPSLPRTLDLAAAARGRAVELLASYSRRKRLYAMLRQSVDSLRRAKLSGVLAREVYVYDFVAPGSFPERGLQLRKLRRRIHRQIEEIKRAGD